MAIAILVQIRVSLMRGTRFHYTLGGIMTVRQDWSLEELQNLYHKPLFELISAAHLVHLQFHSLGEIQVCSLISVKTGGCSEDCKYCAQSSHYKTAVSPTALMRYEEVLARAKEAISQGASRICLGAAWRGVREGKAFDEILKMVSGITDLGVEVCCTLGSLTENQAKQLKKAGLYAYNHNLDTSSRFYPSIITSRSYDDRLDTLKNVETASLSVCCGGILGMGESVLDRLELLHALCTRQPHPDSVPINQLSPVVGTPLETAVKPSFWEFLRILALARITLPRAFIRLSCGRIDLSFEQQSLCFFSGANSIFSGEKLLTVANTAIDTDQNLFDILGLRKSPLFRREERVDCI